MKTYTEKEVIQLFIYYSDYMNDAEQHEENGDRLEFADWLKRHSANTPVIKSVCQKCGAEMEGATTKPQHDAKLPVMRMMAVSFAKWLRDNTVADGAPKLLFRLDMKRYTIEELYDLYTLIAE